jgi:uncharacterized protein YehS (DUF1456 family)
MTNNDTLRRLRYALNINDTKIIELIDRVGGKTTEEEITNWFKREDESGYVEMTDTQLCRLLDGLIIDKRGPHPSGTTPKSLEFLSNNEILKKLRIALELQADEMVSIFKRVEFVVTKAELSAFFRNAKHRNFRKCPEQVLRKFIKGLSTKPE